MRTPTPDDLERLAQKRYHAATGRHWRHATLAQRRAWRGHIEPALRAELGIAHDAVYRDGTWQPGGQADLFDAAADEVEGGDPQ